MLRFSKQKWSTAARQCTEASSWPVEVLGTDEYGTWLGSRQGTPLRLADGRTKPQPHDAVWLVVEDSWYLPTFWFTSETDLTIDVCTPPAFEGETCGFVDMELDLLRRADGHAGVVDEDDWDALVRSGLISDEVVRTVEKTARTLLTLIEQQVEPFGEAALPWLRSVNRASPRDH